MCKSIRGRHGGVLQSLERRPSLVEPLESRQLLSASPVSFKPVTPAKITAGNTGVEQVVIHNPGAASETENVTITLAPSLNGSTAAGSYSSSGVSEILTIKGHGSATVKVPFVPTSPLAAGKYHTLVSVQLGTSTFSGTAPGTYTLIIPPAPTTTPSLIGRYSGLITANPGGGLTHQATFIWLTTGQTLTSLTGQFAVGSQQANGTMTGSESTTGAIQYHFSSSLINYTITGTVSPDGSTITGKFKGTLVNNIFKNLSGRFKITQQTSPGA
jgi:hypothetical protein